MVASERVRAPSESCLPIRQLIIAPRYVPLPKSSDPERVRRNAEVFDFELTEEEMKKLDSMDKGKDGAISWNPVNAL